VKILSAPLFLKRLNNKKKHLKPYQIVFIEKIFEEIENKPLGGDLSDTKDIYVKSYFSTLYTSCVVVYEYNEKTDTLIYWSIE